MNPDATPHKETLRRLGERLAALERHVFEQDKEMLALSRQVAQLRGGLLGLRDRLADSGETRGGFSAAGGVEGADAHAERPPHY